MEKAQLLKELTDKVSAHEINPQEVLDALKKASPDTSIVEPEQKSSHFSITKILYVLGAAIVVIGLSIFIGQIWEDLGSFARISVTLGLGLLLTGTGTALLTQKPDQNIGHIFHFLGGFLVPGGAMVTLSELSTGNESNWAVAITFVVVTAFYLLLNTHKRTAFLTLFGIANGTVSIYLITQALIEPYNGDFKIYEYLTIIIGISYLLLSHTYRPSWNKYLIGALNFFGSLAILGATFSFVFDSDIWEIIFVGIIAGMYYLSVYIRSRLILVLSTIFLLMHLSYITYEYFADSLGWPISLVILGFIFIGLGYASVNINKKYIKQK